VLLVLLVLAAIAIITPFLLNFLQKGAKNINADCLSLDIQPVSCVIVAGTNTADVTYKWASGEVTLAGVQLILEKVGGDSKVVAGDLLNKLETKTKAGVDFGGVPSKFNVVGVIKTSSGDEITCKEDTAKKVVCA
ncbi:MAG: hypothetical protein Q8L29_03690, partial [archaeon]|nr:hypothetical protein [archaeon]